MSRTSETPDSSTPANKDEIRCTCGKCLAKDGMIKCSRCSKLSALPTPPTFRQAAAYHLAARALSARVLDHNELPVKITILPGPGHLGYVQFQPDQSRPLLTIKDMKRQLVVLMAGSAAGRLAGTESPRDMEVAFRQSYELAMRICDFECIEGDRSRHAIRLTSEAMLEAVSILGRYADEHQRLTALLLEKGELTAADINSLTPVEPREG